MCLTIQPAAAAAFFSLLLSLSSSYFYFFLYFFFFFLCFLYRQACTDQTECRCTKSNIQIHTLTHKAKSITVGVQCKSHVYQNVVSNLNAPPRVTRPSSCNLRLALLCSSLSKQCQERLTGLARGMRERDAGCHKWMMHFHLQALASYSLSLHSRAR